MDFNIVALDFLGRRESKSDEATSLAPFNILLRLLLLSVSFHNTQT